MDSLTQIALGASVSELVMQNKVGRKATLWGSICGTLPDLDVLIPMGNAVKDFTYHRAESHAFFYMILVSPLIVWLITKTHKDTAQYKMRWFALVLLTFITHALLDGFTVYGTQMFLPFSNFPIGWSTIFVIDPLYTIPLLVGVAALFIVKKNPKLALKLNLMGLLISCLYLIWGIGIQSHVTSVAENTFIEKNLKVSKTLVAPSPFNSLLWRVIAMTDSGYIEGAYSLLDESKLIDFTFYPNDRSLINPISRSWDVERLKWFTKGFYKVTKTEKSLIITDLRMGFGEYYFFNFKVANIVNQKIEIIESEKLPPVQIDNFDPLVNLWKRIWSENVDF